MDFKMMPPQEVRAAVLLKAGVALKSSLLLYDLVFNMLNMVKVSRGLKNILVLLLQAFYFRDLVFDLPEE